MLPSSEIPTGSIHGEGGGRGQEALPFALHSSRFQLHAQQATEPSDVSECGNIQTHPHPLDFAYSL